MHDHWTRSSSSFRDHVQLTGIIGLVSYFLAPVTMPAGFSSLYYTLSMLWFCIYLNELAKHPQIYD